MTRVIGAAAVALLLIAPASARGDGLPVPVESADTTGIVSADGSSRYVALARREQTVVQRIETRGGKVVDASWRPGKLGIPVVALDGTPAGLSHDGRTLVLIEPRQGFPRARTRFVILDARSLRVRREVDLRGDFSFDAVSPDGSRVFLIQYTSPNDPTKYLVRSLDPRSGTLDRAPIVDPAEEPDEMAGYPMTREVSPDGRWHYTLYNGTEGHPFIHALDTTGPRAKCIDLPASLHSANLDQLKLFAAPDGRTLTLVDSGQRPLARVDTRTFAVSEPGDRPVRSAPAGDGDEGGSALPALLTGVGLLLLGGLVALAIRVRRGGDSGDREGAAGTKAPRALP